MTTRTTPPPRRVGVVASYHLYAMDVIDLPNGRTWADVAACGLKHDTLFVTWRDRTTTELPFRADLDRSAIDTRQLAFEVFALTEDGLPDHDRPL